MRKSQKNPVKIAASIIFLLFCAADVSYAADLTRPSAGKHSRDLLKKINKKRDRSRLQNFNSVKDRFSTRHLSFSNRLDRFKEKRGSFKIQRKVRSKRFRLNRFSVGKSRSREGRFANRKTKITQKHSNLRTMSRVASRRKKSLEVFNDGRFSNSNLSISHKLRNKRRKFSLPRFRIHEHFEKDRFFKG